MLLRHMASQPISSLRFMAHYTVNFGSLTSTERCAPMVGLKHVF